MERRSPRRAGKRAAVTTPSTSAAPPAPTAPPLTKGGKARGKRVASRTLEDQLDAAAAAGNDELTSARRAARPAAVGTTHKTRSRAHMEALDNAIAELFYAENLPDELAESPQLHKLLSLARSAPAAYEPPKRRRLEQLCSAR